jgi:putative Ca2+/H+ antiporter (TMEM165/GDT1 family)
MIAFLASLGFVLLAEMGDKTQLLAMAFATRYRADKVLLAVFLATVINHALAVVTGHFLSKVIPFDIISFAAALSFVGFGIWTIHGDHLEGEDKKNTRFGPVATVAIAFFFAEMGDKTQLATISLAVQYSNMAAVLVGTTLGMVIADAVGITIGILMKKHIPDRAIKWVSAFAFILFGLYGVMRISSVKFGPFPAAALTFILLALSLAAARAISKREKV